MPRYRLAIQGSVTGPHSVEALRQMALMRAFDETALVAPEGSDDWNMLRELPHLKTELFPARPAYRLKEKNIVAINDTTSGEPISVHEILAGNVAREKNLGTPAQAAESLAAPQHRSPKRRLGFLGAAAALTLVGAGVTVLLPLNGFAITVLIATLAITNAGLCRAYRRRTGGD
jgi:hypothetical protein